MNLNELLDPYDKLPLECDGLTRVLHTVLTREGISHNVKLGSVEDFYPHFWIELPTGEIVDYRARMWLRGSGIPHGIFKNPTIEYSGKVVDMPVLHDELFRLMTSL